jgi:hypothetical protein
MSSRYNLMKEKLRKKHASLNIPPTIKEEVEIKPKQTKITNTLKEEDEVIIKTNISHLINPTLNVYKSINAQSEKNKDTFKLVIHKNKNLDYEINEQLDIINAHRLNYIKNMIEKQAKLVEAMTPKELESRKREILVAIHDAWIDSYIENMCVIEISDRPEMIGARFVKLFQHNIIVINKPVKELQIQIEFLGLCWLHHFEKNIKSGASMDAIVSLQGWKCYLCMQIGIEFYEAIKLNKTMYNLYTNNSYYVEDKPFTLEDIHVVSKEFGLLLYPLQETLRKIPEYIEYYPFWSRVPPEILKGIPTF